MLPLVRASPRPGAGGHGYLILRITQCIPFAIVLIGLGIELSPAHVLYTGPLLTAMPALASLTMGPVGTLSAAAGALGVSLTTATLHDAWGDTQIYSNLLGLLVVSVASVTTSNAVRVRRQGELDQVRRVAVAAQEVILRPVPARLGPVSAASVYLAAEKGAQIGGDLYEAVVTPYGVRLIVGDVRGKGLTAVRSAAAVLSAFREAAHYEDELVAVMNHCSAALRREHAGDDSLCHLPPPIHHTLAEGPHRRQVAARGSMTAATRARLMRRSPCSRSVRFGYASRLCSSRPPTSIAATAHAASTPRPAHGPMGIPGRFTVAWTASPAGIGAICWRWRCHSGSLTTWVTTGKR